MFDGRTKGDHIHTRKLLADNAALQAGMNSLDQRIFGKDFFIDFGELFQKLGLKVRRPSGVALRLDNAGAGEL